MHAVADAGPLIHLDEIQMHEPWRLFSRIYLPNPVMEELVAKETAPGSRISCNPPFEEVLLSARDKTRAEQIAAEYEIGIADASVLVVAIRMTIPLVLTDDLNLREAAKLVGIRPVGSIGLVVRCHTQGLLKTQEAKKVIDRLAEHSTLFLTPSLIQKVKKALDE